MLKIANKDCKVALIAMLSDIIENMLEMIKEIEILSREIKNGYNKWNFQNYGIKKFIEWI